MLCKIKPSQLDNYRIFKLEIYEKSVEDMLKDIRGEREPSQAMEFGSQVHKFFETGNANLEESEILQLRTFDEQIPKGINELKFQEEVNGFLFSVVIDRVVGRTGIEFKTSKQFSSIEFYNNSLQWKIYTMLAGFDKFTYYVFTHNDVRPYKIKCFDPFTFYPYPTMQKEIFQWVDEFVDFCKIHNVEKYITVED